MNLFTIIWSPVWVVSKPKHWKDVWGLIGKRKKPWEEGGTRGDNQRKEHIRFWRRHVKAGLVAVDLPLSPPVGKKCCYVYFCHQHLSWSQECNPLKGHVGAKPGLGRPWGSTGHMMAQRHLGEGRRATKQERSCI